MLSHLANLVTCRTYYDGTKMISRLGNPFFPPEWFLESKYPMHLLPRYQSIDRSYSSPVLGLPKDVTLDGELFAGRGEFQSTVSIVRTANSPHWKNITFQVNIFFLFCRFLCGPADPIKKFPSPFFLPIAHLCPGLRHSFARDRPL